MDRTKRTIAISAVLIASVTMLTVGLYLKAMNTDVAETTGMPQETEQMEMMDMMEMDMPQDAAPMKMEMPDMMGTEMMEKEIDLPDQPEDQQDSELSEQDIDAILKEIMNAGGLEMSEEIEVDETE